MAHVCMEGWSLNEDALHFVLFLCAYFTFVFLYLLNVVKSYEMFAVCCEL